MTHIVQVPVSSGQGTRRTRIKWPRNEASGLCPTRFGTRRARMIVMSSPPTCPRCRGRACRRPGGGRGAGTAATRRGTEREAAIASTADLSLGAARSESATEKAWIEWGSERRCEGCRSARAAGARRTRGSVAGGVAADRSRGAPRRGLGLAAWWAPWPRGDRRGGGGLRVKKHNGQFEVQVGVGEASTWGPMRTGCRRMFHKLGCDPNCARGSGRRNGGGASQATTANRFLLIT